MNIAGKYDTQHQEVTIFQDGNSITARYQEKGQVEGKLEGMEVTRMIQAGGQETLDDLRSRILADKALDFVYKHAMIQG